MTTQYVFGNLIGPGTLVTLGDFDHAVVGATGNVGATTGRGIYGTGSSQRVHVAGTVAADAQAIYLGDDPSSDSSNVVTVAASGMVSSTRSAGIFMYGMSPSIVNAGTVTGAFGIYANGTGGGTGSCINSGDISGAYEGIFTLGTDAFRLVNTGTISGTSHSFLDIDIGISTIINRGLMIGDVDLGIGNDRYDGRLGSVIGNVFGGGGNDTFVPGADVDVFDGGPGIDTLDLRMTDGLRVTLGGGGTGVTQGDTYVRIEDVFGSLTGRDVLIGNADNNRFVTFDGDDFANMGNGNDRFVGGLGHDTVWGGGGNDVFVFHDPGHGGDVIRDFSNVAGNNDIFWMSAAGFGGGLTPGLLAASQFQVRADNLAQDADDRFIFRTTDNTLWYDANGSAAGGLTMIADLQAGSLLSAADILIV